jgi:hypothetical protein
MGKTAGKAPSKGKADAATRRLEAAQRVRKHREKMKAMGLKPVTLWLPDVNTPEYKAQVERAIEVINADAESRRVAEEVLELGDFSDWK